MQLTKETFLGMVDHSILKPEMPTSQVVVQAKAAAELGVFSVCVKPSDVRAVCEALEGSETLVGTVIGFPHGSSPMPAKMEEGSIAIEDGAVELDIVVNYAQLLGTEEEFEEEISDLRVLCEYLEEWFPEVSLKLILETSYFTEEQLVKTVKALADFPVVFLKTSTGFAPTGGATVEAVSILREHGNGKAVKASGGVRTAAEAQRMVDAGATRLGCGDSAALISSFTDDSSDL